MAYVIVTGKDFIDIDMVAGIQALFEFYVLEGKDVYVTKPVAYSASVTKELQEKIAQYPIKEIETGDQLIAIDVSSTEYLQGRCGYPLKQFVAIYDHHFESTDYWKTELGEKAVIEEVGAAATLVARAIKDGGRWDGISSDTKVLLAAAIISNSQNFKFSMTTTEDREIYESVTTELDLGKGFAEEYFMAVQTGIGADLQESLKNDTKDRVGLTEQTFTIAQLEMWDTSVFIHEHKQGVINFLNDSQADIRFFLSASLSEDKTYFIVGDEQAQIFLSNLLGLEFEQGVAILEEIMIRKEVIKAVLS